MKKPVSGTWLRKAAAAAVLTVAMFVPLAIVGGPALARTVAAASEIQYSCPSHFKYRYNPNKVLLWHYTHSKKHPKVLIYVSKKAEAAHVRHGDAPATDVACTPVGASASQYQCPYHFKYRYNSNKVLLWHQTHSKKHPMVLIYVSKKAEAAHVRHGDAPATDVVCTPVGPSSQRSGKSEGESKSTSHEKSATAGSHGDNGKHKGKHNGQESGD